MKPFKFALALSGLAGLFTVASAGAAPMPSSAGMGKQVVTVTQNVSETNLSAVRASVAPLVNSTRGFGNAVTSIPVAVPSTLATITPVPVYRGMKESAILAAAKIHFKNNGPALAGRMGAWMRDKGLAFGWFTYTQKIMLNVPLASGNTTGTVGTGGGGGGGGGGYVKDDQIQYVQMLREVTSDDGGGGGGGGTVTPPPSTLGPATEERLLVWTMNTDQNGRLLFGNPVIVPPRPKTLYVIYTPLAMEKGLPADWKYPNAGTLFVQTRDENHVPIPGTDQRIDVNGAFDEPTEVLGETSETAPSYNPDTAIPCLMDHTSGGCTTTISVRSLMDDRGANMAVVDYLRKVQPVYEDGAEEGSLVTKSKLEITKREVRYNGCADAIYYNQGNYLFELQSTATRFLVAADGSYGPVGESSFTETSPSVSYEGQLAVRMEDIARLNSYVINPVDPANPVLVPIAEVAAKTVAPLESTGSKRGTLVYSQTGYIETGDNYLSAHLYVGCDMENNTISVSAGWQDVGSDVATYWSPYVNRYTQGVQLARGTPGSATIYTREDPQHGYCAGTVNYDGNRTISVSMSESCKYGTQLVGGNIFSADGATLTTRNDGLASLFPQFCSIGYPGGASGETPVPHYNDMGQWVTMMVPNSRWGCAYNYATGLSMTESAVMKGNENPCGSNLHSGIFFEKGSSGSTNTYGGKACVAPTSSTWSLTW